MPKKVQNLTDKELRLLIKPEYPPYWPEEEQDKEEVVKVPPKGELVVKDHEIVPMGCSHNDFLVTEADS